MPRITIDISDRTLTRLQALTDATNAAQGTALTPREWVLLHLRELAIADDLKTAGHQLQLQHAATAAEALHADITAARDAMLAGLDAP